MGYAARLNSLTLGTGMPVFAKVLSDRTTTNAFDGFKATVQVHSEIMECHTAAGGFDYLLRIRRGDGSQSCICGQPAASTPGLRDTRTYAVMEEAKNTTQLALGI